MKTQSVQIKAKEGAANTFSCVMSSEVADRDGEVVLLEGMDMGPFTANPVVLFDHGHDNERGKLPIGKVLSFEKTDGILHGEIQTASRPENHPEGEEWMPDTIHALIKQGCLNTVSIGFIVKDARRATADDMEKYGKSCQTVITKSELCELSVVAIPCNQEALITAVSKGYLPKLSKAWQGEVPIKPTKAKKAQVKKKHVVEIVKKRKHVVKVRFANLETIANRIVVRIKGGLYV